MTEERKQELLQEWDLTDNMDDDEYWEWYSDLPIDEQKQIDAWDEQYCNGVCRLCEEILKRQ